MIVGLTFLCALLGFGAGLGLPRPIHLFLAGGARSGAGSLGVPASPVTAGSGRFGTLPLAALTALVCALLAWRLGPGLDLLAFLVLAVAGVTLAVVDVRTLRLPDPVLLVTLFTGLTLLGMESLALGDFTPYWRALFGGATLAGYHLCLAALSRGCLGMGDVKLAGVLGLHLTWLGWGVLVTGAFLAFLLAGLAAGVLLLAGRARRGTRLPFGPWLLLGALGGVLCGEQLSRAHLAW
ncbi:prepilin peptidase [Embleya sp. NBC_00896]|uniref:prepilin peptidase n=1 Tax=Embleya sp. NBC_00896 TaxID=2975961 RepID=UPI00386EC18E|nr:A24 family peptidase [Embleya sp. NBC_00896]